MAQGSLPSMELIWKVIKGLGFVDPQPDKRGWRANLSRLFVYLRHASVVLFIFLHFLSTICRSIRYLPEFFQLLYEDLICAFSYTCIVFIYNHYDDIKTWRNTMENFFKNTPPHITEPCERKSKIIVIVLGVSMASILVVNFFEKYFPLSEEEFSIMKFTYRTKYPNRRLYVNVWIPFIDESEYWYYPVIYLLELYPLMLLLISIVVIKPFLIVLIIHLEAQYKILRSYVEKVGHIHKDSQGNVVFYTNIEANEYVCLFNVDRPGTRDDPKDMRRRYDEYEHMYVRQLLKYHQKLFKFESEVSYRI